MYRKYRIVESNACSVSQYESYRDQVYRYTPTAENPSWVARCDIKGSDGTMLFWIMLPTVTAAFLWVIS